MARTKLIVSGIPGAPSRIEPLTTAEEAHHDILDAVHAKRRQAMAETLKRIQAIVPTVTSLREIGKLSQGDLLTNAALRRCRRIAEFGDRTFKRELRAMPSVATIQAVDVTVAEPFSGKAWPT